MTGFGLRQRQHGDARAGEPTPEKLLASRRRSEEEQGRDQNDEGRAQVHQREQLSSRILKEIIGHTVCVTAHGA